MRNSTSPAEHHRKSFILLLIIICSALLLFYQYSNITMPDRGTRREAKNNIQTNPRKSNKNFEEKLRTYRSQHSHKDIIHAAQKDLPSFPISFWEQNKNKALYYKNTSCAKFPSVYRLLVNNLYWQILITSRATVYLYSAFYDVRAYCSVCPAVRLLGMIDGKRVNIKTYCQIWFADSTEPVFADSLKYEWIFSLDVDAPCFPYLITCPIPQPFAGRTPAFVSLVENICDTASNSLRVIFNKPNHSEEKKNFAVCVKNLEFPYEDQSLRLIEWIETVRLLGADKIVFYTLYIHENMTKVVRYYEKQGLVEITPTTLAGNQVNAPHFQYLYFKSLGSSWSRTFGNEVLQLNDCFYKNMYNYKYIIPLDTDEVIIPNKGKNWTGLMNTLERATSNESNICSYGAKMVMFPDCPDAPLHGDIPTYMHMLQHILSDSKIDIACAPKSFCDTEMTQWVNNHKAMGSLSDERRHFDISRDDAELFHYRVRPYNPNVRLCEKLISENVTNTRMWEYKKSLIKRTLNTLFNLGVYT